MSELSVRRPSSSFENVSRVRILVESGKVRVGKEEESEDDKSAGC